MICPTCKTNNKNNQDAQYCAQCGSDLYVYRLLHDISEEIKMKDEITKIEQESQKKSIHLSIVFIVWRAIMTVFLIACTIFGIFIGMRFLAFMDREESYRISMASKHESRCEIEFEQLQQMNIITKQVVSLILDQRRENQELQTRVQELTTKISKNIEEKI